MPPQTFKHLLKLQSWIKSEDLDICDVCKKPYKIGGLDASLCADCGWILHRYERFRQIIKDCKFNQHLITEEQAQIILLKLGNPHLNN